MRVNKKKRSQEVQEWVELLRSKVAMTLPSKNNTAQGTVGAQRTSAPIVVTHETRDDILSDLKRLREGPAGIRREVMKMLWQQKDELATAVLGWMAFEEISPWRQLSDESHRWLWKHRKDTGRR
jgi:hypothetical protein